MKKRTKAIFIVILFLLLFILLFYFFKANKKQIKTLEYISDGKYHWVIGNEKEKIPHDFNNNVCKICGLYHNDTLFNIFGEDIIIYHDENPYNINLKEYGSNLNVVFYEPNFNNIIDVYEGINKNDFYNENYDISYSYEDSFYRTKHGLMSGELEPRVHVLDKDDRIDSNIKVSDATYVLDYEGNYICYFTNSLDNKSRPIWYNGAYITHDDESAYLLAFGEVPPNSKYKRNGDDRRKAIDDWGEYGRLNYSKFILDYERFSFEPVLPNASYIETDFGSWDYYESGDREQVPYIKGNKVIRGTCRFVFSDGKEEKNIDNRYVFYTHNHYNDFEEYLNCDKGYGKIFGNMTAGNINYSSKKFDASISKKPTEYPKTIKKKLVEILK